MGKRRNTAKTGDKKIYQSRDTRRGSNGRVVTTTQKDEDDHSDRENPMYNRVDRFHNQLDQDFLKLDADQQSENDDDDDEPKEEAVMNLAVGGEDDEDDDETSDDSSEDDENELHKDDEDSKDEHSIDFSSDDDEGEEEMKDIREGWGTKSSYYHGDTADLEIGQDEEDAVLEEQAAKEVLAARYNEMSEEDFVVSDSEEYKQEIEGAASSSLVLSKLSLKDKQKFLNKQHPELLPLISHFSQIAKDLIQNTLVATNAVFDGGVTNTAESIGTTEMGQQYLLTKAMLQSSASLNLAAYLLLKAEQASSCADKGSTINDADARSIQYHPVILNLQRLNTLIQKLNDNVEQKIPSLAEQLANLVKAAELLNSTDDVSESESEDNNDETTISEKVSDNVDIMPASQSQVKIDHGELDPCGNYDTSLGAEDDAERSRMVLTEARFGLRPTEVVTEAKKPRYRRKAPVFVDAGDDDMDESEQKIASHSLATMVNAIEQRSATVRSKRNVPMADLLDATEEDDGELRRGLDMMEEELGKLSDADDNNNNDFEEDHADDGEYDETKDDDDDFYARVAKKSKSKKDIRKNLYKVAPKFPRVEEVVEGERAVNKTILKNRGLVAHKAKINRNPRVKKREQYRKALIRRRGAVRDIRTDEGHKYGGEETGIKTTLSRSRKLAR